MQYDFMGKSIPDGENNMWKAPGLSYTIRCMHSLNLLLSFPLIYKATVPSRLSSNCSQAPPGDEMTNRFRDVTIHELVTLARRM